MMDAKIIETFEGAHCRTFVLKGPEMTMGDRTADIPTVQSAYPNHAILHHTGGKWFIYSKRSHCNVFVNGVRLEPWKHCILQDGSKITLCSPDLTSVVYEYHCQTNPSTSKSHRSVSTPPRKRPRKLDESPVGTARVSPQSPVDFSDSDGEIQLSLRERVALRLGSSSSLDKGDKRGSPLSRIDILSKDNIHRHQNKAKLSLARLCEYDEETKSTIVAVTRKRLSELEKLEGRCTEQEKELRMQKAKLKALMERELTCPICFEVFVKATTLECSHTFCSQCLLEWRKTSIRCPVCRSFIMGQYKIKTIDNVISALAAEIGPEYEDNKENLNLLGT